MAVQSLIKDLGGMLIPMTSLLYFAGHTNSNPQDGNPELSNSVDICGQNTPAGSLAVPFSSAMNYYMGALLGHQPKVDSLFQGEEEVDLWTGWLYTSGDSLLLLLPRFKPGHAQSIL